MISMKTALSVPLLLSAAPQYVAAWGNSGNSNTAIYGNSLNRDWLYNSQGISIAVHGCLWSYMTDKNSEDAGCQEQSSEDGTTTWYWMSNCRRAQVAFSVYASQSSSSPSCSSNNFKESFVTTTSVLDFVDYLQSYGIYTFSDDGSGNEFPMCGGGNGNNGGGGNIGLSCSSDGSFILEKFNDDYCLTRTGNTYNSLSSFNSDMKSLNCINVYTESNNYNGGNDEGGNNHGGSVVQYLIGISNTCSSHDSGYCSDSSSVQERLNYVGKASSSGMFHHTSTGGQSWFTKLKYVTGGLLLLASFVMFTGILFTNRRRRRALMQRKYRQAKRSGRTSSDRSRRSSRSVSKHRGSDASRKSSSRSRRSKSRDTRERESPKRPSQSRSNSEANVGDADGIMT
ncbi:hypothetical protein ACA910_012624 [Epithemia clementina (nom. ined.)]